MMKVRQQKEKKKERDEFRLGTNPCWDTFVFPSLISSGKQATIIRAYQFCDECHFPFGMTKWTSLILSSQLHVRQSMKKKPSDGCIIKIGLSDNYRRTWDSITPPQQQQQQLQTFYCKQQIFAIVPTSDILQ
jgi:hypothetical protein